MQTFNYEPDARWRLCDKHGKPYTTHVGARGRSEDNGKAEFQGGAVLNVTNETCTCITPGDLHVDPEEAYCDCVDAEKLPNQMEKNAAHDRDIDQAQEALKYEKLKWVLPVLSWCIFVQCMWCLLNYVSQTVINSALYDVPHDHEHFSVMWQCGGWVVCTATAYLVVHRITGERNPTEWMKAWCRGATCLVVLITAIPLLIMWKLHWFRKKANRATDKSNNFWGGAASDFVFTWALLLVGSVVILFVAWTCLVPFVFQFVKESMTWKDVHRAAFDSVLYPSQATWMMDKLHPSQEVRSAAAATATATRV